MRLSSVILRKTSLATIFLLTLLICIGHILEREFDHKRQPKVSIERTNTSDANSTSTAVENVTTPTPCPKSDILDYTEVMKELPDLRPLFNFSLTPWKVQHEVDTSQPEPEVQWSMIVMVKSHSKNVEPRRTARKTWASLKHYNGVRMETIFIVGKAQNPQAEYELLKENKEYGDLLQLNREEKYRDLIFKTVAGMQYAGSHFPCDWIYVSADDDIMPNLTKIYEEIKQIIIEQNSTVTKRSSSFQGSASLKILCGFDWVPEPYVRRMPKDKWFVSIDDYPHKIYPSYCHGAWYSMRIFHAKELYDLSRRYPFFWIDDVWITGTLRLMHIRNDEDLLCTPTEVAWGLEARTSITIGATTGDLVKHWTIYCENHLKPNVSSCQT